MKYLLYGIVRLPPGAEPMHPAVYFVGAAGLAAAAVPMPDDSPPSTEIATLLEFERTVQILHHAMPIIPLRYGCWMQNEFEILHYLQTHREEYLEMLNGLEGMSEMGLRLILPASPEASTAPASTPGAAYLERRRRRLGSGELTPEEIRVADGVAGDLLGWWSRRRAESVSTPAGRLLSLYFLVPKALLSRFPAAIDNARRPAGAKLLLTGPWPPYNFVECWARHTESTLWRAHHSSTSSPEDYSVNA